MKKLLIWDGDNTLWNGIVANGDEIHLPIGRHAQSQILSERGVLQAMATHNLPQDLEQILHRFELSTFFLYNQADFGVPKSEMVRRIIVDYDIAKDTDVVYLDDDPFNRADVKQAFPGVTVSDPIFLDDLIASEFSKPIYTEEDRLRVRRYQSEIQRKQAGAAYGDDHQAFLKSCYLTLSLHKATEDDFPRIVDLMRRANRMAALSRPYSESDLRYDLNSIIVGKVHDRFGDYGLSAVMIVKPSANKRVMNIDALVISCRLQGRGIGSAILGSVINSYDPEISIVATWESTEYNHGIRGLYEWYKFDIDEFRSHNDCVLHALLQREPECRLETPPWIKVEWV